MECGEPTTSKTNSNMVASLHARKEILEAKLREKTLELKKLCIQEAELTGILPPETPIEPSESPPVFRRKVDTAFTYPENLIDKLKSKDEEALAKLELECKIQSSIAEAALGLANDANSNKSIRRKHRFEYQRAQQRLSELEMRLNVLKQSINSGNQLKQRKKPRPPFNVAETANASGDVISLRSDGGGGDEIDSHIHHEPTSLLFLNRDVIRNSHFYNSFGKSSHNHPSYMMHHNTMCPKPSTTGGGKNANWNRNELYRRSVESTHRNSACYEDHGVSTAAAAAASNWLEDSSLWRNTAPVGYFSNQCYTTLPSENNRMKSRYSSLDRRYRGSQNSNHSVSKQQPMNIPSSSNRVSPSSILGHLPITPPIPYNDSSRPPSQIRLSSPCDSGLGSNAVLLPNQTYPENSLTRTQSLGNVEQPRKSLDTHSLQEKMADTTFNLNTLGRRIREKEWRETSLDVTTPQLNTAVTTIGAAVINNTNNNNNSHDRHSCTPPLHPHATKLSAGDAPVAPQRPFVRRSTRTPPPLPPPHNYLTSSPLPPQPPPVTAKSPVKSPTQIESSVPFESPKNHTVVEVGKWQPYREVTKPFEMSDFYKYSTKFRKSNAAESGGGGGGVGNRNEHSQQSPTTNRNAAAFPPKPPQNTCILAAADNPNVNYARSNDEDVNKNNLNEIPVYGDAHFNNNITYRRHCRLATNDRNEINNPATYGYKQWSGES